MSKKRNSKRVVDLAQLGQPAAWGAVGTMVASGHVPPRPAGVVAVVAAVALLAQVTGYRRGS